MELHNSLVNLAKGIHTISVHQKEFDELNKDIEDFTKEHSIISDGNGEPTSIDVSIYQQWTEKRQKAAALSEKIEQVKSFMSQQEKPVAAALKTLNGNNLSTTHKDEKTGKNVKISAYSKDGKTAIQVTAID